MKARTLIAASSLVVAALWITNRMSGKHGRYAPQVDSGSDQGGIPRVDVPLFSPANRQVSNLEPSSRSEEAKSEDDVGTLRGGEPPSTDSLLAELERLEERRRQFLDAKSQVVQSRARELIQLGGTFPDAPTLEELRLKPRVRDEVPMASVMIGGQLIQFPLSDVALEFSEIDEQDLAVADELVEIKARLSDLGHELADDHSLFGFLPDPARRGR